MQDQKKLWQDTVIKQDEIDKYLIKGKDFINEDQIYNDLQSQLDPDKAYIRELIQKSLDIQLLSPQETAALIHVTDPELLQEMAEAGAQVKKRVYDNRIVTFAPLYCSNKCVNGCVYCGFRDENTHEVRKVLTQDEVRRETEALAAGGHKRLIMVYGEHPSSSADYIAETLKTAYSVKVKTRRGHGQIRRININAAPMSVEDLKKLWKEGIGTYQVFQETYHHGRYAEVHPKGIKSNYQWRLYALHRALDAGIDDVAIGALFGVYDWKFEVMGLLYHAWDLENRFKVGPHTISFPRITPSDGNEFFQNTPYKVNDAEFKKLVTVLRLAVPYAGMIITARETPEIRRAVIPLGCTQTDASTRIGVGSYSEEYAEQEMDRQQFEIGDSRGLDDVVRDLADLGMITSFCTAGYRCGRTGDKIMGLLKSGVEGKFCKMNAILTFREWLDDFASEDTKKIGEALISKEIQEMKLDSFFSNKNLQKTFDEFYNRIEHGERDLYI